MIRVLASSCLLGQRIRYNGMDAPSDKAFFSKWEAEGRLVNYCAEISVGFPIPRRPAETVGGDGNLVIIGDARVFEDTGADVTKVFLDGAHKTLEFAQDNNVRIAILTDGSPSCGSTYVYDGNFQGGTVPGQGVVAALLRKNGIHVFSEDQIEEANELLEKLEAAQK